MSSHAALGVVRAGVAALKGSGVRINCISPGQIDIGIDLKSVGSPKCYLKAAQRDVPNDA